MTAKLELFKNLPFDGVTSLPYFVSATAQASYFDAYTDKLSLDCVYSKLGEPVLVSYDYDTLTQYSYGRAKTKDKWYYFTVASLDVVNDAKVKISYVLDCFTTAYRPYDLTIRNCHVTRRASKPDKIPVQGIQPISKTASNIFRTMPNDAGSVFFTATKQNASGVDELVYCMIDSTGDTIGYPIDIAESNTWDEKLGIQPSSIKNVWFVPDFRFYAQVVTKWTKDTYGKGYVYYTSDSRNMPIASVDLSQTIIADELHDYVITDFGGTVVYNLPYQVPVSHVIYALEMTTNTCYVSVTLGTKEDYDKYVENLACKVPCKNIDFFIDAYSEYASAFRQVEIQERKYQNEKALVSGIGGSVQTAGFGAVGGGGAGAAAGLAGGLVSAVSTYAVNYLYEGKEQALTDAQYRNSQDSLVCIGNSMRYASNPALASVFSIWQLEADAYSLGRYNAKVATYGYDVNEYYSDVSMFISAGFYAFEAEVIGNVLMDWKNQIAGKLASGVRMVTL